MKGTPRSGRSLDRYEERGTVKEESEKHENSNGREEDGDKRRYRE